MKEHESLVTSKRVLRKLRCFWASEKNRWGATLWSEKHMKELWEEKERYRCYEEPDKWSYYDSEREMGKWEEGWRRGEGSISNLGKLFILLGTTGNVFPIFGSFQSLPIYYIPSTSNPKFSLQDDKRQHKKFWVCSASFYIKANDWT